MWRWRLRAPLTRTSGRRSRRTSRSRPIALSPTGLSPAEARAAARRAFGNATAASERYYESRRPVWLIDLGRDVRYGLRLFARTSRIHGRRGAHARARHRCQHRHLFAHQQRDAASAAGQGARPARDRRRHRPRLSGLGAVSPAARPISSRASPRGARRSSISSSGGETRWVDGLWASGSFFDTLGVPAVLGPHR